MNKHDTSSKPEKVSVKQKKNEKDADELQKIVTLTYSAFAAVANALESEKTGVKPRKARMLKKFKKLPAHLDRAIVAAESYTERDQLYRRLAGQCYNWSKWFMKNREYKQATKWMALSWRFLRLSLDPKKLHADEQFEAKLQELEKLVKKATENKEQPKE